MSHHSRFNLHKTILRSLLFCDVTQHRLVVSCQCFRTIYRSQFQVNPAVLPVLGLHEPFKDGTDGLSQNDGNYQSTPHNIPEECILWRQPEITNEPYTASKAYC